MVSLKPCLAKRSTNRFNVAGCTRSLPVTMVSQALQLSMRLQQQMTELAIKGDDALSTLRPAEESPEWATFDEDDAADQYDASTVKRSRFDATEADLDVDMDAVTNGEPVAAGDPWAAEERAIQLGQSTVLKMKSLRHLVGPLLWAMTRLLAASLEFQPTPCILCHV